jgi:tetratricopeptide (TPR) repeat protein
VDDLAPNLGLGKNNVVHVYDVQSFCAINAGMYNKALPLYQRAKDRLLAVYGDIRTDAHAQHIYMLPVIAMVRTGRWNDILSSPAPDSNWKYATVLDDFAKGIALVRTKQLTAASDHLQHLEMVMQDPLLAERVMPFNAPVQLCRIAAAVLKGELLYAKGNRTAALQSLQVAVVAEDRLIYREPQEWLLPARQYLGACLVKMKRYSLAEQTYREDLVENPGNGWSQVGMYQCLKAMGKKKRALQYQQLYVKAFKDADVMPVGSVY